MDQDWIKWIAAGIGSPTLAGFLGWLWRQRQAGLTRERAKDLEITTLKVSLAIAETKLAAYGKSAPDVISQIDALTERVARLLYEAEPRPDRGISQEPWPYPRTRPIAPRRGGKG